MYMKSVWSNCILLASVLSLSLLSCDKDDEVIEKRPPVAGKGGTATLRVIPQFNGADVDSCKIYIKYNTLDVQTVFDDSLSVRYSDGRPTAVFYPLKSGNYFLYAKGWYIKNSLPVSGTLSHTITEKTATTTIEMPVK